MLVLHFCLQEFIGPASAEEKDVTMKDKERNCSLLHRSCGEINKITCGVDFRKLLCKGSSFFSAPQATLVQNKTKNSRTQPLLLRLLPDERRQANTIAKLALSQLRMIDKIRPALRIGGLLLGSVLCFFPSACFCAESRQRKLLSKEKATTCDSRNADREWRPLKFVASIERLRI